MSKISILENQYLIVHFHYASEKLCKDNNHKPGTLFINPERYHDSNELLMNASYEVAALTCKNFNFSLENGTAIIRKKDFSSAMTVGQLLAAHAKAAARGGASALFMVEEKS